MSQRKNPLRAPALLLAICSGVALPGVTPALAGSYTAPQVQRTAPIHSNTSVHTAGQARAMPHGPARPVVTRSATPVKTTRGAARVKPRPPTRAAVARPIVAKRTVVRAPTAAPRRLAALTLHKAVVPAGKVQRGTVMHYYPGLFETVARNRGMRLRTDVDGYASRPSCGELGRVVVARILNPRTGAWGPWRRYQILDCSARRDLAYQRGLGLILEVDYRSAAATGFLYQGRSAVEVKS